jgi:tRNA (mo5U34)-methyltransferase
MSEARVPTGAPVDVGPAELRRRVAAVPIWYHVLELAPGVVTPGEFDMRPFTGDYGLPASLAGQSVVDVGASNGFFSFHLERLGARRVVAVDLLTVVDHDVPAWYRAQWLTGKSAADVARIDHDELEAGFALAHEVYRSRVEKRRHTVYELGAALTGEFDLAFCNNLLHHLRDPVGALESIRRALRPGGTLVLGCSCDLSADASYAVFWGSIEPHVLWWVMSKEAILRMCRMAGFARVEWRGSFRFAPVRHPERVGVIGVIHAVAP